MVTSFAPFEVQVRGLLEVTPSMLATVLAERVGWTGSATWFRQNVARIRPHYVSPRLQWTVPPLPVGTAVAAAHPRGDDFR